MKRILIVGAKSYVGESFSSYLNISKLYSKEHGKYEDVYEVDTLEAHNLKPRVEQFRRYDVVLFVAGIVHRKETRKNAHLYYEVNRDLAIMVAEVAKQAGVHQFILISTMAVYGMMEGVISKNTKPNPTSYYGKSKLQADRAIWKMKEETFRVAILRPPMIYGNGCKGNYQNLRKLALKVPVFPKINNKRSMLYIDNLCEFLKEIIDEDRQGLFFPQNAEYVNIGEMVYLMGIANGNKVKLTRIFNLAIICLKAMPLKTIRKVFGSLRYEKVDIVNRYSFDDSISLTESHII